MKAPIDVWPPQQTMKQVGNLQPTSYTSWGVSARLAPFLENSPLYNSMNFTLKYSDPTNTTVSYTTISYLICPSEPNPSPNGPAGEAFGVSNYGWCVGDWYVFGGTSAQPNRSAFCVNLSRRLSAFTDGLSNTVVAAEVRAYQPIMKSCFRNGSGATFPGLDNPNVIPDYSTSMRLSPPRFREVASSTRATPSGQSDRHVTMASPRRCRPIHRSALDRLSRTSTSTPSTRTTAGLPSPPSRPEATIPAASTLYLVMGAFITSRAAYSLPTWRAMGSIAQGEIISSDSY